MVPTGSELIAFEGRILREAKTLFLVADLGVGGSETKTVLLANALRSRGHQITVGWLSAPNTLAAEIDPAVERLPLERQSRFDVSVAKRLAAWISQNDPSAIICVNLYPTIYALPARALARHHVACVTLVNSTEFANRKEALQMRLIYRFTLARMRRVIYGCDFQRDLLMRRYGLNPATAGTIYNGVRLDRFRPSALGESRESIRQRLGVGPNHIVVGTVGAMRPEKAQADLIRAVGALVPRRPELRVLLVGDGVERPALEALVQRLGIADKVIFAGRQNDVRPFLHAMDVFALPSLTETFSNATLEAMAMHLPVVLGSVGGAPEMIVPNESGFLFRPGDVAQLTDLLDNLVKSADVRTRLAGSARSRVEQCFSFEGMLRQYEELLDSLRTSSGQVRATR